MVNRVSMSATSLKEAILEALVCLGGCGTISAVTAHILQQYGNKWTDIGTAMADLCPENKSSCYPMQERILTRIGRGKYCLGNKISTGRRVTVANPVLEDIDKKIISCLKDFQNDENYFLGYKAVMQIFDSHPINIDKVHVLVKVAILNTLYNTNILDKGRLTNHIQNLAVNHNLDKNTPSRRP